MSSSSSKFTYPLSEAVITQQIEKGKRITELTLKIAGQQVCTRLFQEYPPWAFYRSKKDGSPVRIFNIADEKKSAFCTGAVGNTGLLYVSFSKAEDLTRVERWTADDLKLFHKNAYDYRPIFEDPLGFAQLDDLMKPIIEAMQAQKGPSTEVEPVKTFSC